MKFRILHNSFSAFAVLLVALIVTGCVHESLVDDPGITETGREVTITVNIPGQKVPSLPATRSIDGAGGEAAVRTIDILVFQPGMSGDPEQLTQYVQASDVTIVSQSPNSGDQYKVTFKAGLTTNASASTVVLVANVPDLAARITGVVDKNTILARLMYASTNSGGQGGDGWKWNANNGNAPNSGATPGADYTPIPMYGECGIAPGGVKEGMKIDDVRLVRMLARIDLENNADDFTLSDVYVVNYNTAGYIAPAWKDISGEILKSGQSGYPYDTNGAPLIPVSSGKQKDATNAMHYAYPATGGLTGEIYTYEAVATTGVEGTPGHTDAACIIIKGRRSGDTQDQFYRIDFTAGIDGAGIEPDAPGFNPATVQYMPLYRNHSYTFDIEEITGPGYSSVKEALGSLGIRNNLKTSLLVVDESGITDIVFDNNHFLGIGTEVEIGAITGAEGKTVCTTNHTYGWQIDTSKGTDGIEYMSGTGWLQASKEGNPADLKANLKLTTLADNIDGTIREAWVHIKAGTLNHKVKVRQDYVSVTFTPSDVYLPGIGTMGMGYPIRVSCTNSQGSEVPGAQWSLTIASGSWATLALTQNNTGLLTTQGSGSATVYLFAEQNPSETVMRTVNIMNDMTGLKAFSVTQDPYISGGGEAIATSRYTYVGAFWRADQTGERLIRITNIQAAAAGAWSAYVLEYGDFEPGDIVFSLNGSTDPNIYTNNAADMYTHDATYQVTGNQQTVAGTVATGGEIFFRIGLKSKWSSNPTYNADTRPVRYAVVVISYNNNTKFQKLFLRQGHEADYLMRPGDKNSNASAIADNRSYARKFVPYNLTHPNLKNGTNMGGTSIAHHPIIPARTSIPQGTHEDYFTSYPSQAGAFFQWTGVNTNYIYERKAYHPTSYPTYTMTGWASNCASTFWDTLEALHETCPPGYRRPNDGTISEADINGSIASSEMRQSLWLNPETSYNPNNDNSVLGYYADGFFDRRPLNTQTIATGSYAYAAVAINTGYVAYAGRLFFNPATGASLFMPSSGYRRSTNFQLYNAGGLGHYWSSSSSDRANSWYLNTSETSARQIYSARDNGLSIRCVRE